MIADLPGADCTTAALFFMCSLLFFIYLDTGCSTAVAIWIGLFINSFYRLWQ